jgi:hypothetical protein
MAAFNETPLLNLCGLLQPRGIDGCINAHATLPHRQHQPSLPRPDADTGKSFLLTGLQDVHSTTIAAALAGRHRLMCTAVLRREHGYYRKLLRAAAGFDMANRPARGS